MAKIHRVDISNGDFEFLNRSKIAEDYLDQELNYYFDFHDWAMEGEAHPAADRAREWLKKNKPKTNSSFYPLGRLQMCKRYV